MSTMFATLELGDVTSSLSNVVADKATQELIDFRAVVEARLQELRNIGGNDVAQLVGALESAMMATTMPLNAQNLITLADVAIAASGSAQDAAKNALTIARSDSAALHEATIASLRQSNATATQMYEDSFASIRRRYEELGLDAPDYIGEYEQQLRLQNAEMEANEERLRTDELYTYNDFINDNVDIADRQLESAVGYGRNVHNDLNTTGEQRSAADDIIEQRMQVFEQARRIQMQNLQPNMPAVEREERLQAEMAAKRESFTSDNVELQLSSINAEIERVEANRTMTVTPTLDGDTEGTIAQAQMQCDTLDLDAPLPFTEAEAPTSAPQSPAVTPPVAGICLSGL